MGVVDAVMEMVDVCEGVGVSDGVGVSLELGVVGGVCVRLSVVVGVGVWELDGVPV